MLSLNLQPIFAARGIQRPYSFLVKAGFTTSTAHNLVSGELFSFQLRHIDKLCTVLNCTPNDLLVWSPNSHDLLPDSHPLTRLKDRRPDLNWQDTIKTAPLDELERIVSLIKSLGTGSKNTSGPGA